MKYQSENVIKKDVQIFTKATRIERKHFLGARTKEEDWISGERGHHDYSRAHCVSYAIEILP